MEQDNIILIISQQFEQSTDKVLQYLDYYNEVFCRINGEDFINDYKLTIDNKEELQFYSKKNNISIDINKIKSVWYRRGKLKLSGEISVSLSEEELNVYKHYYNNLYLQEIKDISSHIYMKLSKINHINMIVDNNVSKLIQLSEATDVGLLTPKTIITNSLDEVIGYFPGIKRLIYKSIRWNNFSFTENNKKYSAHLKSSELITIEKLLALHKKNKTSKIGLSKFQEYIEKKIEIRSFYLKGKFYSMAIFSQQNEDSKVDWRDGNGTRTSIFKLPKLIEGKSKELMMRLDLNCGSLDFIYTPKGEYVFLEVNPLGQFEWLSQGCNYNIEKEIANELRKTV